MPRNLPWRDNVSTAASKPVRKSATIPTKRKRVDKSDLESDSDEENPRVTRERERAKSSRAPSTSPPPNPPPESFMRDGLEQDDKYRLVEDELLAMAQQFTVHLHAAEYKKQQKMVQSQNAQTIKSISRPTVGVMPDHTKRQKEAERTEGQRKVLSRMSEKTHKVDDDSDSTDGLPYIGTTLHSLMDSPRRRGIVLSKFAPVTTKTRSAAGYTKPRAKVPAIEKHMHDQEEVDTSSDEDDDLDAPVQAPRFFKREASSLAAAAKTSHITHASKPTHGSTKLGGSIKREKIDISTTKHRSSQVVSGKTSTRVPATTNTPRKTVIPRALVKQEAISRQTIDPSLSPPLSSSQKQKVSRFERARLLKAQQEKDESQKPRDIIPSFLR